MNVPVAKNDEVVIDITAQGSEGQGIGRVDGYAVFVEGAISGETVRAKIIKVNSSYGIGKLMEVLTPAACRIEPPCPVYARCGGCTLQHMSYEAQLAFKQKQVLDALERLGGFAAPHVRPCIGMDEPWRYRNKAAFPFGRENGRSVFGLYAKRSHRIVPVSDCMIQRREAADAAGAVADWATECGLHVYDELTGKGVLRHVISRTAKGKTMVTVVTTGGLPRPERLVDLLQKRVSGFVSLVHNINKQKTNVIAGEKYRTVWGEDFLSESICGLDFAVSSASFLQVNPIQTQKLYDQAIVAADIKNTDAVIDLYCGIGTITLSAARRAKHVTGIEIVPQAIENAIENAAANGIDNAEFICGEAEKILPQLVNKEGIRPDVILLDPPRKGCEPEVLEAIAATEVKRVVYVSCNPATLARDCKLLAEQGYELEFAQPVDMFPQTAHVETVARLTRSNH